MAAPRFCPDHYAQELLGFANAEYSFKLNPVSPFN
jgi:hypothetical protein